MLHERACHNCLPAGESAKLIPPHKLDSTLQDPAEQRTRLQEIVGSSEGPSRTATPPWTIPPTRPAWQTAPASSSLWSERLASMCGLLCSGVHAGHKMHHAVSNAHAKHGFMSPIHSRLLLQARLSQFDAAKAAAGSVSDDQVDPSYAGPGRGSTFGAT